MSTDYERHSPKHDAVLWVLIVFAVLVAAVIFLQAL